MSGKKVFFIVCGLAVIFFAVGFFLPTIFREHRPAPTKLPPIVIPGAHDGPVLDTWEKYFRAERDAWVKDETGKALRRTESWITLQPGRDLTVDIMKKVMGDHAEVIKVEIPVLDQSERPEVLTLYKYNGVIFVTHNLTPKPDQIVRIMFGRK